MQLSIEEYLKECWKNKQEVIDVSAYKLNEEELNKVIFGIHYENPEYYWVLRNTAINKDEETGFVKTYYQYYEGTTGKPLDRSEELEREWEVVKEKTKYCKTDIEKALVVHEHLCDTIVYSSRLQAAAHDIEGAIFEKEAVCEGYALAYKYYMNRLEIPCKIVSGTSNGQSHAWNQIQLNGNWYMVDPTWDDVANSHDVKHQYFLCSENKFPNHVWNKESELYETCSDTTYDNLDWKNDLQGMYAYQGGLYRSKSLIVGGKEVSGIWRIDAENIEKEAELVLPITDQWQLNSVNVVRGYSQLSYYDGMLYYNTPRAVWRWNFDPESEPEKVFELDQSIPGEIWDAEAANGKIYYETGVYEKGERQKGQYVFDEDYRKAKHPIAVTKPVMTVVMGGENVFLQSAAPGNVTYTSKNPEICDVQVVWKDESCQLIPKKAGETIVTVHADPTDHYAEGAVDVKVIVKERDDIEEKITLQYEAGDGGSIAAVDAATGKILENGAKIKPNAEVQFTASPNSGYSVKNWVVNGEVYKENGADGLLFLPYLMGERSPLLDEKARGAFIGLSGGHGRGHLIRAVLEGVTYSQRQCVDVLRGMNVPTEEMMACGGGARSAFWRQMLADVYGCPIQTAKAALEGPALGVAILAGVGTGVYPSVENACDAIVKPDTVLYPDAECGRAYEPYYQLYLRQYPALRETFHALAAMRSRA